MTLYVKNCLRGNDNLKEIGEARYLANLIAIHVKRNQPVAIDFSGIRYASPTFLINMFEKSQESVSAWDLTKLVKIENANASIISVLATSVFHYWYNWNKPEYISVYNLVKDIGPKTTLS